MFSTKNKWVKIGLGLAACYAAYRWMPNQAVKAAALGAAGTIVISNTPVIQNAINATTTA